MLKIYELDKISEEEKNRILKRSEKEIENLIEKVDKIIEDIRKRGDEAIIEYCEKFDNVKFNSPEEFKVTEEEINEAYEKIDKDLIKAIKRAKRNIEKFHKFQMERLKNMEIEIEDGVIAGRRVVPLDIAGLYVPGGKAVYQSVMLMLSTPAKVAKVKRIIVCTPTKTKKIDY
ncbi:MAG: histidinol dehydrogenase, partial [Candidatus Altarchaeaceae archaeon]